MNTDKIARFVPPVIVEKLTKSCVPNLWGDRIIEWSFALTNIPKAEKGQKALDIGSTGSFVAVALDMAGYETTACDLRPVVLPYKVNIRQCSVLDIEGRFDLVTAVSVLEHIEDDYGVIWHLNKIVNPGCLMIITVPVGVGEYKLARLYNEDRINKLLNGWEIEQMRCWAKLDRGNKWEECGKQVAFNYQSRQGKNPLNIIFALFGLVARKR